MKRSVDSFKAGWRAPAPRQPKNWPGSSICRFRRCRERSSALRRTVKRCAAGSGRIVPGKNGVIGGCSHGFTVSRSGDSGGKSSRSRRPTSCSSCFSGSMSQQGRGSTAKPVSWRSSGNWPDSRPASAWERYLLPARISKYDPALLDRLCLSGSVAWGRLTPPAHATSEGDSAPRRRIVPTSLSPISLFPREDAEWLLRTAGNGVSSLPVSPLAEDIHRFIQTRGASFFSDIVKGTGHLSSEVEQGLWELVAAGSVSADGFDNLRALLDPRRRRAEGKERTKRPRHALGRWSLLRQAISYQAAVLSPQSSALSAQSLPPVEQVARQLLRRYGVVFRDLLQRESLPLAWRDLLVCYRKMELRGLVRGGRFVSGFIGEQFV